MTRTHVAFGKQIDQCGEHGVARVCHVRRLVRHVIHQLCENVEEDAKERTDWFDLVVCYKVQHVCQRKKCRF